jgi:hypothetical protein
MRAKSLRLSWTERCLKLIMDLSLSVIADWIDSYTAADGISIGRQ